MKTMKLTIVFILCCAIALGQNKKSDPRLQLDSLREVVLIPKLKIYDQQVEKFTSLIESAKDKHRIKEYAKELAQVSDMMEDQIATLYNYGSGGGRSNVYFGMGMGMGPGFYPGMGMYPGYYSYAYLPPVYYDVDRIKRCANNIRFFTGPHNVQKKLEYIHKKERILKSEI